MHRRHNHIDGFTMPLAITAMLLIFFIYPAPVIDLLDNAVNKIEILGGIDKERLLQQTQVLAERYKWMVLLVFYLFYFLFLWSRKQDKKNYEPKRRVLVALMLIGSLLYTLGSYYLFPARHLSLQSGSLVSITTHLCIIAVIPLARLSISAMKSHSLKTDKNLDFVYDNARGSKPNNLIYSLYCADGWVNYSNVFQGFFGSGGAGSGKSVSLVEPFLWQMAEKNMPGLIFDFKNWELTRQIIAFMDYHSKKRKAAQRAWDESGWKQMPPFIQKLHPRPSAIVDDALNVRVVDFMNPKASHRVNFLQPDIVDSLIKVDSIIKKFLTALSPADAEKKDIWFNGSVALFKGGLLYLKKHHPELCSFPHIVVFLSMIPTEQLKALFLSDADVTMVSDVYVKAPENTAGSIAASLSSSLSQLVDPRIFWVLSGDDIDFKLNSKENPTLLCLVTDEEFARSLSPLASIISMTCLNAMNKKGRVPSMAIFDEFPQIFLDDIDRLPATCRSNKVGIMCVIQDLAQLLKEYGDKRTKALTANLLNKVYFKATDADTQKAMSDMMGEVDEIKESQSRGQGDGSSNFSVNRKKYLNPDDVLNFTEGEGVGVKSTGKKERRYHSRFRTLFKIYDGKKAIKNTGYPGMPLMSAVLPGGEKAPITFNAQVSDALVEENYNQIKIDIEEMVKADLQKLEEAAQQEKEAVADAVSENDMRKMDTSDMEDFDEEDEAYPE